jgi:hypothetical protein
VSYLVTAAVLVVLLFVSTMLWALRHIRTAGYGPPVDELVRAQMWASGVSFAQLVVLILACTIALFVSGDTGISRLLAAISSPVIVAGLVLSGMVALYPAYLCARVWRSGRGLLTERFHLALHLAGGYALAVVLLCAGRTAG